MTETTVVYIAGYGRSGSTLLDLLLGRLDGWFSMGEFRLVWYAVRDGWRCGCGTELRRCPVWSEVLARSDVRDVRRVLTDRRDAVRVRHIPGLVQRSLLGRHRAARDRFEADVAAVYAATAEVTGASVLVDSSKDPVYGLFLAGVAGIRLHVVHLVRDSRAVAWSWQRTRRRPEIEGKEAYQPVQSSLHTSLEWDGRNALVHLLGRRAASYTRITYEALVADPDTAVARISAAVTGVPGTAAGPLEPVNHTVGGNPMRFERGGLTVEADVEWEHALGRRDRRIVTAMTWPLLRAYGYG